MASVFTVLHSQRPARTCLTRVREGMHQDKRMAQLLINGRPPQTSTSPGHAPAPPPHAHALTKSESEEWYGKIRDHLQLDRAGP